MQGTPLTCGAGVANAAPEESTMTETAAAMALNCIMSAAEADGLD